MAEEDIKKNTKFDIVVIGAGPAGIMAAITASEAGAKVALIEKNSSLGKKLLLTGNGRCNLTNAEFNLRELTKNYNNGEFLFHAFSVFGPKRTIDFFEKLGVKTKIENNKRVFPKSNNAKEILEALVEKLKEKKVETLYNSEIIDIKKTKNKITKIVFKDKEITAKNCILCTGGKSYCATGSDGFGYKMAEKLGHTVIKPKPALAPIILKEEWVKNLQGISLKDIKISIAGGKNKFHEDGEIIFTKNGMSGPAVLNISGKVGDLLDIGEVHPVKYHETVISAEPKLFDGVKISIDLFPKLNQEEVLKSFEEILNKYQKQIVKNILSEFMPERLAEVFLSIANIDKAKIANNMSKAEKAIIARLLKNIEVT
ncbi:MAG: aminoacetone oxidase family FAD-binding enzyme, partial [Candidatus Staskawiczbacteria bacterium]|nr:aminoacetone oxidase family FAD-binding enzyme [Candidatus Staskawiczbacteria bacterium]